jgi:hypothetical protein
MSPTPDVKPLSMLPQASAPGPSMAPPAAQAQPTTQADLFAQYRAIGDKLTLAGKVGVAKQYYDLAEKLRPEVQEVKTAMDPTTNQPVQVITFKDGSQKVSSFGALPDNQVVDLGGEQVLVDKNTGRQGASFTKTVSPDSAYNRETQLKVQQMIDARQKAADAGEPEAKLQGEELRMMAEQALSGDKSVFQNLGRGKQGAENIVALRREITRQAKVMGLSGADLAAATADFEGLKAGLRTSANISARVENAISEAKELAPLAIAASAEVSRSGLLPFGKVQVMFNAQTNDPALKRFATANNGLVSAYAGAMARGQKPTVSDYDHAREILAAAQSHDAYVATVKQMFAEMEAASRAPQNVREHLRGEISGKGGGHSVVPVAELPKKAVSATQPYADAEKERRYQEWKRSQNK